MVSFNVPLGGHFLRDHPERAMRDANGKLLGRFCCNSGYLEAVKQIGSRIQRGAPRSTVDGRWRQHLFGLLSPLAPLARCG